MSKTIKDLLILVLFCLFSTLLIWLPHILRLENFYNLNFGEGFANIYRNYDGLEYVVIAKTFYNPIAIAQLPNTLPASYYAAHFPGYSLAILAFSPILGMLKSMLFTSLLFTVLSAVAFYFLVRDFKLSSQPLFLSIVFLILPARWLIVHSIGSSEPMFIFFIITSIYYFLKYEAENKFNFLLISGLLGLGAQLTRPPGILLFIAYVLYIHWKYFIARKFSFESMKIHTKYFPLILMPLGLLVIFYWFGVAYKDFFAYFHSGDNIHLALPPFQVFNKAQFWVGEIWLEDVVMVFILGLLAGLLLVKQKLYLMAFFVLTYLGASSLVAHRDISRYTLPIFPFALIAFEKVLVSKEFKIVLVIITLAVYLYAQNFIINNVAPIPNLGYYN